MPRPRPAAIEDRRGELRLPLDQLDLIERCVWERLKAVRGTAYEVELEDLHTAICDKIDQLNLDA